MLRDGLALAIDLRSGCHFRFSHPPNGNLRRRTREAEDGTEGDVRQVPYPT